MKETRAWLERHGLVHYAEVFDEHDIGLDIIKDLSESEFKALGVSIGDRKRRFGQHDAPAPRTDTLRRGRRRWPRGKNRP